MLQHPGESLLGAVASTTAGGGGGTESSGLATPTNFEQSGSNSQPLTPQSARGGQMSARGGVGGGLLSAPTSPLARNNGNVDSAPPGTSSPSELLGREFSLSVSNNGGGSRRATLNPDRPPAHSRPGTLGGGGGRTHSVFGGGHRRASSRHNVSPFGLAAAAGHGHSHGPKDQNALIAEAVFAQSVYTAAQHQQMHLAQLARDAHGERSSSGVPIPLSPHTAAHSPIDGGGIASNLSSPHGPTSSSSPSVHLRRGTGGRETMANITLAVKRGHHVHQKLKASPFNVPQARRK